MSEPDFSNMRSGAMPGKDAEEQERWAVQAAYGDVGQREAARIADEIMSEPMVGSEPEPPWDTGRKRKGGRQPGDAGWGEQSTRPLSGA